MLRLIDVIFFMVLILQISGKCSEEGIETMNTCYTIYFDSFNFTYIDSDSYGNLMKGMLKSMEGIDTICKNYGELNSCLGSEVIDTCTTTASFAATNFSMGNAPGMISNYFIFDYMCGPGYKILQTDFDCLSSFPNGCYYDLDTCNQWYDMIHCISKSAQKECSDDAKAYMFETLSIEECYMRPDCKSCPADNNIENQLNLGMKINIKIFTFLFVFLVFFGLL